MKIANLRVEGNRIKQVKFLPQVSNIYIKNNCLEDLNWLQNCQTDFIAILNAS